MRVTFKFGIGDRVAIQPSDIHGEVVGCCVTRGKQQQFCIRHVDGHGQPTETWQDAVDLVSIDQPEG